MLAWSTSRVRVCPAGEQNGQAADELGRSNTSKQARLMQTMNENQNRRFRKQAKKEAIMLDLLGLTLSRLRKQVAPAKGIMLG
jgi:hypothetical protein